METRSTRLTKTYKQRLCARPDRIFPLLCPEREKEWAVGWDAARVYSESGVAEANAIFTTPDAARGGDRVWLVTRHDPELRVVEFAVFDPAHVVTTISVALTPDGADGSFAEIVYAYTGLSDAGNDFVREHAGARFDRMVVEWEAELNHFLRTGTKLR